MAHIGETRHLFSLGTGYWHFTHHLLSFRYKEKLDCPISTLTIQYLYNIKSCIVVSCCASRYVEHFYDSTICIAFLYILYVIIGGQVIFNLADYWYSYKEFGVRLEAMLQASFESGTLESLVKERSVYIYPIEDATVYVLNIALTS